MKRFVWLWLFSLFAAPVFGQHRGGVGTGLGRRGFNSGGLAPGRSRGVVVVGGFGFPSQGFINLGIPPVGPSPPLGGNAAFFGFDRRFGFPHHVVQSSGFFPDALPLFAGSYDNGYPSAPNIIIIQQPAPQVITQQAPREVVRPEIREYKEPAPAAAVAHPPAQAEGATFVIALDNGSRHSAYAVWVQNGVLHYIDSEDRHHQVPLKKVDRELTRKLNRDRKLDLWLPAAQ